MFSKDTHTLTKIAPHIHSAALAWINSIDKIVNHDNVSLVNAIPLHIQRRYHFHVI